MKERSRFSAWSSRGIWSAGPKLLALLLCLGAATIVSPPASQPAYIYVADRIFGRQPDRVAIYPRSTHGDQPPLRTITGGKTKLYFVQGVAVDEARNIYVSSYAAATVYAAGASGNVKPIQDITGIGTGLDVTGGIASTPATTSTSPMVCRTSRPPGSLPDLRRR